MTRRLSKSRYEQNYTFEYINRTNNRVPSRSTLRAAIAKHSLETLRPLSQDTDVPFRHFSSCPMSAGVRHARNAVLSGFGRSGGLRRLRFEF
jgi:hypothetical protein